MFSNKTISEIESVAHEEGINPACLLAVAEVESGGRAFAVVGGRAEPVIRFEGHYFDRLVAPEKREAARKAGVSSPRPGGVANPREQAGRWALVERAAGFDRHAALQAVSWGIGQVMGAHWKVLGYESIDALVAEARGSVAGQVRLMMRFIRRFGLLDVLEDRDWAAFARRYNGPGFRKNHYDTRLAAAYARHSNRRLLNRQAKGSLARKTGSRSGLLSRGAFGERVRELQRMLTASGHAVAPDGRFGPETEARLKDFQKLNGLTVDGIAGPATRLALRRAVPGAAGNSRFAELLLRVIAPMLRMLVRFRF